MLRLLNGRADRAAVRLMAAHGFCGESEAGVWPLDEAVKALMGDDKWSERARQFRVKHKGDSDELADQLEDLWVDEKIALIEHAYVLGLAVGRRLGPQALGGAR
jgi:hypothetical protein